MRRIVFIRWRSHQMEDRQEARTKKRKLDFEKKVVNY